MQKTNNKLPSFVKKLAAAVLAISFLAAGCGGGNKNPQPKGGTITIWKTFEDSEYIQPLIDEFTRKHPSWQVVYTKKNIENYEQDLLNALAAGNGPDIFSINNAWLPKYLDKVEPAPESVFTFKDYKDAFVDVVVKDFSKDQKIYGTSLSVDSLALYYNKDILGTAGIATPAKTWNELSNHVQRIKKQDKNGYFSRSGVALGTNGNINRSVDIAYLLMLQQGAVPYDEEGVNPTFTRDVEKNGNSVNPAEAALDYYTSYANPASLNYNWNMRSDYSIDAFANGRTAYLYSYSYTRDTILQKAPNLNFDVAPVPQPNLDDPTVNFANYWGEVVSKQSPNKQMAWELLKFITSKDSLNAYYANHRVPSSRKDLVEYQIQDPEIGVFAHANLTAKSFYRPDQARFDSIFGQMIDNVILHNYSVDEALSEAETQASTITRE